MSVFEYYADTPYIRGMKPWVRFLFIFIAYGLALLHTAVPHHHANSSSNGETVFTHAGCLFSEASGGLLQRVLSTDLGLGHLETFKKGADAEIDFTVAVFSTPAVINPAHLVPGKVVPISAFLYGYIGKFHNRLLLLSTSHFRAPPQHC